MMECLMVVWVREDQLRPKLELAALERRLPNRVVVRHIGCFVAILSFLATKRAASANFAIADPDCFLFLVQQTFTNGFSSQRVVFKEEEICHGKREVSDHAASFKEHKLVRHQLLPKPESARTLLGICPVKRFRLSSRKCRLVSIPREAGIVDVSRLWSRSKRIRLVRFLKSGIGPVAWVFFSETSLRLVSFGSHCSRAVSAKGF